MVDVFAGDATVENFVKGIRGNLLGLPSNFVVVECQICGGFPPPKDPEQLKHFNVEGIYDRLYGAATNNLVCASELSHPSNPDRNKPTLLKRDTFVDNSDARDTGFVYKVANMPSTPKTLDENYYKVNGKVVTAKLTIVDKTMLSIHLPGDGPNAEGKTIADFLKTYLPPNDEKICGIFGDTNITEKKSRKSRAEIVKEIVEALTVRYSGTWIVIMSDFKVSKTRFGFALANHQLKKSEPIVANAEGEADGTIFAFKIPDKFDVTTLNLAPNHTYCISGQDVVQSTDQSTKPIFTFNGPPGPTIPEPIFLDHSVLQFPASVVGLATGMELSAFTNIIVLNMGSIANSAEKNWATDNSIHSEAINAADKFIYDKAKEYYSLTYNGAPTEWSSYETITGSAMGGNIDKCIMTLNEGMSGDEYKQIVIAKLTELKTLFDSPASANGGKRRRKTTRKNRNKTSKYGGKKRRRSNKRKPKSMKV
jgi:hypothetical protein